MSDISFSGANLRGSILSTGGEVPHLTIVWGDEDGGKDFGNLSTWDHNQSLGYTNVGPFSLPVSDLLERKVYYFRVVVSNSVRSFVSDELGVFATGSKSSTLPDSVLWLDASHSSASTATWMV